MPEHQTIGVGIIGLGFMGQTHLAAYLAAGRAGHDCRVVAVCDTRAEQLALAGSQVGNIKAAAVPLNPADLAAVDRYADVERLLARADVHLVSICTPTDSHVDLAIAALQAGKHVLVEKPIALRSIDVGRLQAAAERAQTICMPAMCLRFWPEWAWLAERIAEGTFGAVHSAVFQRLGSPPPWSQDFYGNPVRSGGALVDLHVHDVDFLRFCFGEPAEVISGGSTRHVTTIYRFPQGPRHVTAEGGWTRTPGCPFRMRYSVAFANATAEFDLGRNPDLMLGQNGSWQPVEISPANAYEAEISHILKAISTGQPCAAVSIADAQRVTCLLEAERRSLESGSVAISPEPSPKSLGVNS